MIGISRCALSVFFGCLAVSLTTSTPATGQTTAEGSIRGYVKDAQGGVLPGATITATSPTTPGVPTAVSDAEGFYRLLNLAPGEYTLVAQLDGFSKSIREGVVVRAALNLSVDIVMTVGGLTESVEVRGDSPMIEASSPVQAVNIDGEVQRQLPINTRQHWSDFLGVTPGVSGIQVVSRTADSYTLRGSNFASHVIQIDGADMASAQQNATIYVNLSTEALGDVQVKTGGVDASAPLGVGAVISIATKSGTNRISGTAGAVYQAEQWNGNNNPGGTIASLDQLSPELSLGGPVIRDRVWFFGAYRRERIETGIARTPAQIALLRTLSPAFEPFNNRISSHLLFTKATAQVASNQQFQFSYQYDPQDSTGSSAIEAGQFITTTQGGALNVAARLSSAWSSTLTSRLTASYNNKGFDIERGRVLPNRPVHANVVLSGGRLVGSGQIAVLDNAGGGSSFDAGYYKTTLSGDLTWYRSGWLGSHEAQSGFYLQPRNHYESNQIFANGGFAKEEQVLRSPADPAAGIIPFWREVFDVERLTSRLGNASDYGFYVQDAWRPTPRLTVNAGLRVDLVKNQDKIFDITVQDSTEIGPRFGVNYMLTADQRNVVRASWVKVHDVISINPASAGTITAGKTDFYDTNLDGVFETQLVTPGATALATNRLIDLGRGQPYINEWMAGYRRQFPDRLTMDASFIRREYRNRTALVERNGIYDGGVFRGFQDERLNEIYELTENVWNWQVYSGLELQVTKDTDRLQVLGSYTRGWRHMAGDWQPNDPASFIQPDAFANDKGIGPVIQSTSSPTDSSSLSPTQVFFDSSVWVDHLVRVGAVFRAPWRILVATNYSLEAGRYSGPIFTQIAAPDPRFGPRSLVLSNGRVATNPLATTLRLKFPTRGEEQLMLPSLHIWNVRVGRSFPIQGSAVELALDVFNVTNNDADQAFQFGANQDFSPVFGLTQLRQLPRSARVSVRYVF